MSYEGITIEELIKELEKHPKDKTVEISVTYDNCEHVQPLKKVSATEGIEWIVLRGK